MIRRGFFLGALFVTGLSAVFAADSMTWSCDPPGGIAAKDAPMFVCIGFDDNAYADGVNWFLDFSNSLRNKDGSPVRVTFFLTAGYAHEDRLANEQTVEGVTSAWKRAYNEGHEIGNHTQFHESGSGGKDQAYWSDAIGNCTKDLINLGIPADAIHGFRTPFLEYGDGTFQALNTLNFVYDCSIESGFNWFAVKAGYTDPKTGSWVSDIAYSPGNTSGSKWQWWPYTLENGPSVGSTPKASVKMPGVWEVQVDTYQEPLSWPSSFDNIPNDMNVKIMTSGFDYNCWKVMTSKEEFLNIMKFNLQLRLQGGHAPLAINAHTDYYSAHNSTVNDPSSQDHFAVSLEDRRWAVEEFVKYAIQIPEVRVVPFITMIDWMKHPVPSSEYVAPTTTGSTNIKVAKVKNVIQRNAVHVVNGNSIELTFKNSGTYNFDCFAVSGEKINTLKKTFSAGTRRVSFEGALPAGMYIVKIAGPGFEAKQKICLTR